MLEQITGITQNFQFNMQGFIALLGREDFDQTGAEEVLVPLQNTLDNLQKVNAFIMDAVIATRLSLD